jgi:membrane protein implicated in regulation of membrane protease activity
MDFLLPEWLLALTITLFALDIYLATEFLSWCGIVTFASYITWRIDPAWEWKILIFILSIPVGAIFYYSLVKAIRPALYKNTLKEISEKLLEAKGTIHYVDDKPMFKWNGDELWAIDSDASFKEGQQVIVTSINDGTLTVSPIS